MSKSSAGYIKQSVSLPKDVAEWLKKLAASNSVSVSRLIQDAIRAHRFAQDNAPNVVREDSCAYGSESTAAQHSVMSAMKHISKEFDIPEKDCWNCLMDAVNKTHHDKPRKEKK